MVAIAVKTLTQTGIGFHIPSSTRYFCGLCKPLILIKGSVAKLPGLFIGIWKNVCKVSGRVFANRKCLIKNIFIFIRVKNNILITPEITKI